ncbi:MAG TPA: TldD/PmbA family protein [Candidatus Woesearchaeota archaeon]|nr:TldD/PmbA family protein [Candidatus Woesearchaeota archaeon]
MLDFAQELKKIESKAEYADIRISDCVHEKISIENSNPTLLSETIKLQYGVRVFCNGSWGFSSGNNLNDVSSALQTASKLARLNSVKKKEKFSLDVTSSKKANVTAPFKINPTSVPLSEKLLRLGELNKVLNQKKVSNRTLTVVFSTETNFFQNTSGASISEEKGIFDIRAFIVGKKQGKPVRTFGRIGRADGYDFFQNMNMENFGNEILSSLDNHMIAKKAPAGKLPILMSNDLTGVFFHEALGHACEADAILENCSVLKGKLGEKIAPSFLNVKDSANIPKEHGYYKYDDEGMIAGNTTLIKNGILKGYMHSMETANRMGVKPTGNGRAQNPKLLPIVRMTNTIVEKGNFSKEELLKEINCGIYAIGSSGGVVEPTNGNFLFNAQDAFLIENGKIKYPLKDVSFGGNILDTLQKIKGIGRDAKPAFTGGFCGKGGQMVPVGESAPHVLISEAMVGGTNK